MAEFRIIPDFKDKPQGDISPENYRTNWKWDENDEAKFAKKTISEIFKDTELNDLYEKIYIPASGWVHWDSLSMCEAIHRNADGSVTWHAAPQYLGAVAIASGFHSLLKSAMLLDKHFNMGFSARLNELFQDYVAKKERTTSKTVT